MIVAHRRTAGRTSRRGVHQVGGAARADADPAFRPSRAITWRICRARSAAPLTADEMQAIAGIDRNCRLIKGQVFLWKENQTWEDLWDLNGEITRR